MSTRNPFTSITNLSFVRNINKVTSSDLKTKSSLSSEHKYFNSKKTFMNDAYLDQYDYRKRQQSLYSKVMGVQTLRYHSDLNFQAQPPVSKQPITEQYYNVDNYRNCDTYRSDFSTTNNNGIKTQTRDMFGSDFYKTRQGTNNFQQLCTEQAAPKKTTILRKDTGGSSRLRFKKQIQINDSRMTQLNSSLQQSRQQSETQRTLNQNDVPPLTLYVKSKKTVFHLYINPYDQ